MNPPRAIPAAQPLPNGDTKCFHECLMPRHPGTGYVYFHILQPGQQCFFMRYRKCEACFEFEKQQMVLPFKQQAGGLI